MPPETTNFRELTRRLVAREAAQNDAPDGSAIAVRNACERTYRELMRWVGPTGAHTLLTRALTEAGEDHALLKEISVNKEDPVLDGVAKIVQVHGVRAVTMAFESVLVTLLSLLGRLVGDDIAIRLVELPTHTRNNESQT